MLPAQVYVMLTASNNYTQALTACQALSTSFISALLVSYGACCCLRASMLVVRAWLQQ